MLTDNPTSSGTITACYNNDHQSAEGHPAYYYNNVHDGKQTVRLSLTTDCDRGRDSGSAPDKDNQKNKSSSSRLHVRSSKNYVRLPLIYILVRIAKRLYYTSKKNPLFFKNELLLKLNPYICNIYYII